MKRYFKFRKDFRCNWHDILGAFDTSDLKEQIVEYDTDRKYGNEYDVLSGKHKWHNVKSDAKHRYCDVFIFESDGETQEYANQTGKIIPIYFVKKEEEYDNILELCDAIVFKKNVYETKKLFTSRPIIEPIVSLDCKLKIRFNSCIFFDVDEEEWNEIRAAIWTSTGLIYVAKMKGILPNGEIDWELL